MKPGDYLFVYGSLRRSEAADLSLRPGCSFICEDSVPGKLYAVGWYPGIKELGESIGSSHRVKGDVFRFDDSDEAKGLINWLDGYEGYPSLFDRRQIVTENGHFAWVYTYNHEVSEAARVHDGDWCQRIRSVQ